MPHHVHEGGQNLHLGQHSGILHLGGHVTPHHVHEGGQQVHLGIEQQLHEGNLQLYRHLGGQVMLQQVHDGGQRLHAHPLTCNRQHGLVKPGMPGGHAQHSSCDHNSNI
eukprot:CAMPEP_0182527862 /NCGR_PEP_ID=MMETSP1323-20130603/4124_1 /TAXON_ID=236787 /ORGANISM="Florenciella parvula, Strain RCC1693" /LENGTH=108 /DNA_ID=CAMNT_0024736899 /DNA_START=528 /DNA_END=854 /DNA_ORIENTATION=-